MNYNNYKGIQESIFSASKIVLSTHTSPDGDTLGSALGLYHFLKSKGIKVQVVCPNKSPDYLAWMPQNDIIISYESDPDSFKAVTGEADLIVHIDYNAFHRTGDEVAKVFNELTNTAHIMIDHHPSPDEGFRAYVSDTSACSTAQLVYQFTQFVNPATVLTKEAAICLYVGLITDTGSFNYGMTDEKPYLMAADLVKAGIDDRLIHEKVYSNNNLNRLKLLGFALSEKLVVNAVQKWAYISLSHKDLEKYNYQPGDTEGIVNYALSINGILAAVLLTEKEDKIRMSFRSKGDFAVNAIAREHFDGGG
ncbi:MAG: DHH family phosphoesterase, partial [Bacteroidales bacterium]|nr:DHH family phosphoesterase [Bacteroidales bacterium]